MLGGRAGGRMGGWGVDGVPWASGEKEDDAAIFMKGTQNASAAALSRQ